MVWNSAKVIIEETKGDVLVIFDCCYAGELATDARPPPNRRAYEFLAATAPKSTTPKPGPRSFTSALIHSMKDLAKSGSFNTQELVSRIKSAPNFPKDQWPRLYQNEASQRKIMLPVLTQQIVKGAGEPLQQMVSESQPLWETGSISSSSSFGPSQGGNLSSSYADYSRGGTSTLPSSAPKGHDNTQRLDTGIDDPYSIQITTLDTPGDEDDTATLYSLVTDSSAESDEENYQAHFGLELFSYISSLSQDENDMSRLVEDLPKLLQIFTRKLGSENSAQAYRDIMRYVHKHRL